MFPRFPFSFRKKKKIGTTYTDIFITIEFLLS